MRQWPLIDPLVCLPPACYSSAGPSFRVSGKMSREASTIQIGYNGRTSNLQDPLRVLRLVVPVAVVAVVAVVVYCAILLFVHYSILCTPSNNLDQNPLLAFLAKSLPLFHQSSLILPQHKKPDEYNFFSFQLTTSDVSHRFMHRAK